MSLLNIHSFSLSRQQLLIFIFLLNVMQCYDNKLEPRSTRPGVLKCFIDCRPPLPEFLLYNSCCSQTQIRWFDFLMIFCCASILRANYVHVVDSKWLEKLDALELFFCLAKYLQQNCVCLTKDKPIETTDIANCCSLKTDHILIVNLQSAELLTRGT